MADAHAASAIAEDVPALRERFLAKRPPVLWSYWEVLSCRTFWTERAWESGARPEAVERLSAAMSKLDDDAVAEHAVYCQAVGVSLFSALPAERRAEVLALAREQRDAWLSRH